MVAVEEIPGGKKPRRPKDVRQQFINFIKANDKKKAVIQNGPAGNASIVNKFTGDLNMQLHERKILDRSRSQIRAQKATLEISGNFERQKFHLQQENS